MAAHENRTSSLSLQLSARLLRRAGARGGLCGSPFLVCLAFGRACGTHCAMG